MHKMGYSFMGDRPMTGLTRREELLLQLGFLVEQEQKEKQRNQTSGRRRYSKPRKTRKEAMDDYKKKVEAADRGEHPDPDPGTPGA